MHHGNKTGQMRQLCGHKFLAEFCVYSVRTYRTQAQAMFDANYVQRSIRRSHRERLRREIAFQKERDHVVQIVAIRLLLKAVSFVVGVHGPDRIAV